MGMTFVLLINNIHGFAPGLTLFLFPPQPESKPKHLLSSFLPPRLIYLLRQDVHHLVSYLYGALGVRNENTREGGGLWCRLIRRHTQPNSSCPEPSDSITGKTLITKKVHCSSSEILCPLQ